MTLLLVFEARSVGFIGNVRNSFKEANLPSITHHHIINQIFDTNSYLGFYLATPYNKSHIIRVTMRFVILALFLVVGC